MAIRVFWTDTAITHLKDIFDYYKENASIEIARKLTKKIVERTIQLENNPHSGQIEPLLEHRQFKYRYLIEGNYKIIYWLEKNYANVATVFDCRQNPKKIKQL